MAAGALVEEVATNLEEAAEVTRRIDPSNITFLIIGLGMGLVTGFVIGKRYNREKITAEIFQQSQEELAKIREVYLDRSTKVEVAPEKPPVEEIVEERGYKTEEVEVRPLPAPVPVQEPLVVRTETSKDDGWDYPFELSKRTTERPYVIHQDEYSLNETGFNQAAITYYAQDGVVADEDDSRLDNVNEAVGLENLTRFGHGTDDANVVFVRNPRLQLEFEICRLDKSYEQEVEGLEHSDAEDFERMPRRRIGFKDDNEE
jgi:hypothetical protein